MHKLWLFTFGLIGLIALFRLPLAAHDQAHWEDGPYFGSVLIYHRFGENDVPSTNIRLEQFEEQLAYLKSEGRFVFPGIEDLLARRAEGKGFDRPAVVITADDAYNSIYHEAWPRLKAAGIPLAIFVASEAVDAKYRDYMTWDMLRTLKDEGVTILQHGSQHLHMLAHDLSAQAADLEHAQKRFQEELGITPALFAYPYGEYDQQTAALLETSGFTAAFAQFSAPLPAPATGPLEAGVGANMNLPRFAISERYSDFQRFQHIVNSRPMPAVWQTPNDPIVTDSANPPAFSIRLRNGFNPDLALLNCFPSHQDTPAELVQRHTQIDVNITTPFPQGRSRINCTYPIGDGQFYWLGKLIIVGKGSDE